MSWSVGREPVPPVPRSVRAIRPPFPLGDAICEACGSVGPRFGWHPTGGNEVWWLCGDCVSKERWRHQSVRFPASSIRRILDQLPVDPVA